MPWHASRVGRTRPELFTCLSLLCHLAYAADAPLLQWDPDDVDLDGTGVPSHRVEIRISDPNTQCDKSKPGHKDRSWMTEMQHERNYLGLLDFGQMEAQGFLVSAIRPPTTPQPQLRITLCSEHRQEDIDGLLTALQDALS